MEDRIIIRDPIHGSIPVNKHELTIISQPVFQRLRNIKQLGFTDIAFPGATHSRFCHSLGAMHVATMIFDRLFVSLNIAQEVVKRFRQTVRLAMLTHDVGHAPLSHATEHFLPNINGRKANHEDYTVKFIVDSSLSNVIREEFCADGIEPAHIVALLRGSTEDRFFTHDHLDFSPLLRQIISSECDADRMDYLQRDSLYCGVNYGKFDADWLINNMVSVERNNRMYLGIKSKAIFTFEDFLLSRYHMFASVYLHHTPVIFEQLLQKYMLDRPNELVIPSNIDLYLSLDDIEIVRILRQSDSVYAKHIIENRPYFMLDEANKITYQLELEDRLRNRNIEFIKTHSKSILSKYYGCDPLPMFVVTTGDNAVPIEEYSSLYSRYQFPAEIYRLYVSPKDKENAVVILNNLLREGNS